MKRPQFKRTVLSSAIALACCHGQAMAVPAFCPATVSTAIGQCLLTGPAALEVTAAGSITGSPALIVDVGATGAITNAGLIDGTKTTGIRYDGDLVGTLTNSGTIQVDLTGTSKATAIYISGDLVGTLTNSGLIKAHVSDTSTATAIGIYIGGDLSGTLTNSGTILAQATKSNTESAFAYGIQIDGDLSGTLTNSGSITAQASGSDDTYSAYGIYVGGDLSGTLTNSGSITAKAFITSDSSTAYAYGIYVGGNLEGTLTNSGSIFAHAAILTNTSTTALAIGINVSNDMAGTLTNSGSIRALAEGGTSKDTAVGIYIGGNLAGTLTNSGSIEATAIKTSSTTGFATGIYVDGALTGTLTNSGSISARVEATDDSATKMEAYGVYLANGIAGGTLNNSGQIVASVNGSETKLSATVAGVYVGANVASSIVNSGTIEARAELQGPGSFTDVIEVYGVYIAGDYAGTFDNSGTLRASIDLLDGATATKTKVFALFVDGNSGGGTFTNSGTISGDVHLGGGTLNLNGGSIDGDITSSNPLDVNIGGTFLSSEVGLVADSNIDAFTIVNGGHWRLDGEMTDVATFAVAAGGRLGFAANGVNLAEDVTNAGTVAVENGLDATITGNYTHLAGGVFEVAAPNVTDFGQLMVTGTADLSASNVIGVDVTGILQKDAQMLDVLSAGTLTAGAPTTVDNSLLWAFTAIKDGNTVDLTVDRGLLLTEAVDDFPFALGAAEVLDELLNAGGTGGDLDAVLLALSNLATEQEVGEAVAQLVSSLAGQGALASWQNANLFSGVVGNRITGGRGLSAGDGLLNEGHLWIKPFGGVGDQSRRDGVPGFDVDTVGIAVGGDARPNERLLLGAGFAWSDTEIEGKTLARNEVSVDSYQMVLYGSYDLSATDFVDGYAIVGWNSNDSYRNINFGGLNSTAVADYDSIFTRVYAGLGRQYQTSDRFSFTPVATLRYTYIDEDGYREQGAGALDLTVAGNDEDSLILGVDGVAEFTLDPDKVWALTARGGLGYDVLSDRTLITSTFAGGGGAFATQGAEADEFVYRAGVGLKATPRNMMSVRIDYEFEGREDFASHGGSINFRWRF